MKIVKLYYLNDEQKEMIVRVLDLRYDHFNGRGPADEFTTLKSCEGREFEVHMPDNAILYVKKWKSMVMLSYHEQIAQPQSSQPGESLPPEESW